MLLQLAEEGFHRLGVVPGAGHVAHRQLVRFQFVLARVGLQPGLCAEPGHLRHRLIADHGAQHGEAQIGRHGLAITLGGVPRRDVADFVGQNAGYLGLVFRQSQQAPRNIDVAAGQGEGIDDVVVQYGEMEGQVGHLGVRRQETADPGDIAQNDVVFISAVVALQDFRVFLLADLHLLAFRHEGGEVLLTGCRVGRAGGKSGENRQQEKRKKAFKHRHDNQFHDSRDFYG